MSSRLSIGTLESDAQLWLDVPTLIDTRALITGNSGAGKSRLLRRMAEQAFGKVQVIVIDPEGEFATLREKHDFLLAGRTGEVQAEPRAAALLAKRLMELNVSAVLDLYDLRLQERRSFVKLFLEALVDLPKDLYAPVLVLLDEAHLFCPEKDEAESAGAVIDLMTRGRKRGVCGILATQRLSKLDKDAAAEAKNVFVGGITLDVDQKRAADTLGLAGRDERLSLRDIPPGRFLAFGPALSAKGVSTFTAGETFTTHPKAGQRHKVTVTATPEAIQKVAAELKDLPQQAAEEIRTLQAAQSRVRDLERELRAAKKAQPPQPPAPKMPRTVEVPILRDAQIKRFEVLARMLEAGANRMTEIGLGIGRARADIQASLAAVARNPQAMLGSGGRPGLMPSAPRVVGEGRPAAPSRPAPVVRRESHAGNGDARVGKGEIRILAAIAQHPDGVTRAQITVLTGYKRSSRDTYVQRLRAGEFIDSDGDTIRATEAGVFLLGADFEPLPTGEALRDYWRGKLPAGEKKILEPILDAYPDWIERETIDVGLKRSARDTYLQRLSARQLIRSEQGQVRAADHLFAGPA